MKIETCNPEAIRHAFKFLIDEFQFVITRDEELRHGSRPYGFVLEYRGNDRRVQLIHDYKENFFYFTLIRGLDTKYPNEQDRANIISFWRLFNAFDPQIDLGTLQPDGQTCAQAAEVNAQLLKKYCSRILLGQAWV